MAQPNPEGFLVVGPVWDTLPTTPASRISLESRPPPAGGKEASRVEMASSLDVGAPVCGRIAISVIFRLSSVVG